MKSHRITISPDTGNLYFSSTVRGYAVRYIFSSKRERFECRFDHRLCVGCVNMEFISDQEFTH
jgi:hypothetical protein